MTPELPQATSRPARRLPIDLSRYAQPVATTSGINGRLAQTMSTPRPRKLLSCLPKSQKIQLDGIDTNVKAA
jgi:hypothetical protein